MKAQRHNIGPAQPLFTIHFSLWVGSHFDTEILFGTNLKLQLENREFWKEWTEQVDSRTSVSFSGLPIGWQTQNKKSVVCVHTERSNRRGFLYAHKEGFCFLEAI